MSGTKNRKMDAPVLISMFLESNMIYSLDRQAKAISKKQGFKVSRSEMVRSILENYLDVAGV